jgi:hypothetical protein
VILMKIKHDKIKSFLFMAKWWIWERMTKFDLKRMQYFWMCPLSSGFPAPTKRLLIAYQENPPKFTKWVHIALLLNA